MADLDEEDSSVEDRTEEVAGRELAGSSITGALAASWLGCSKMCIRDSYEIPIMSDWTGKSIASLNIRRKYNVNILAVKNGASIKSLPGGDYIFEKSDHIIICLL